MEERDIRIDQILAYVQANPACRLREAASVVGLSPSRLEQLFKRHTGGCLREHFVKTRMERARHLLVTTKKSVKEIAAETGYSHPSSFVRAFTRAHVVAPGRLRRSPVT